MKFNIKKSVITKRQLEILCKVSEKLDYTPCDRWLGYHKVKEFDLQKLTANDVPKVFLDAAHLIFKIVGNEQKYNKIVVYKFEEGNVGKPHFDPRNIKGQVIAVPFGECEGGEIIFDGEEVDFQLGDLIIRNSTFGYSMSPKHSVKEIKSGTRYVLEFQTFIKEKLS